MATLDTTPRTPDTERGPRNACTHCGLPVPRGARHPDFCCPGCETVHALLNDEGLQRFYDLGGGKGHPVGWTGKSRERDWLPVRSDAAGLTSLEVDVQGIHCAACVWLLQEVWRRRKDGAVDLRINPSLGRMHLTFDAALFDVGAYFDACENLGYRIGPPGKRDASTERELLVRLGACTVFAMNAMVFAVAEYFGMTTADTTTFGLFRWLSFGLATLSVLVGGPVFFRAALAGLKRRVLHLDLPIALGIALGYGASLVAFATGLGDPYFDSVTVFVALMVAGRFVQRRALRRNRDFLLENDGTEHVRVRRLRDDDAKVDRIAVAEVLPGDRLALAPGDLLPTRAKLVSDRAMFSLDWINGESDPRRFDRGDEIPAGAFVQSNRGVVVEAACTARESGLHHLLATPSREAGTTRSRFWELLNRVYVAAVLGIAAVAALVWSLVDPSRVVDVVTAVLIVTCPCALGIATPLAFELALAGLRRRGVFVRRGELLEKARHVRRIVFDKTGTLTWGGVRIETLRPAQGSARDVLYTMAQSSNHPVSQAIAASLEAEGATFLRALEVEELPGEGLRAHTDEHEFRLGRTDFTLGDAAHAARDVSCFTRDGHVEACFSVDEDYRAGADEELDELRAEYELFLASGDRTTKVERAADRLGFDAEHARGDLSPDDKAEWIRHLDRDDTLMVGDGLNDAPAFEAAFCAGTPALDRPVMPGRADFFYVGSGTGAVSSVLESSRRFHTTVRANLWLAGLYNAAALGLCLAGVMQPWLVAVLMPISSILLIANTMRGMRANTEVRP